MYNDSNNHEPRVLDHLRSLRGSSNRFEDGHAMPRSPLHVSTDRMHPVASHGGSSTTSSRYAVLAPVVPTPAIFTGESRRPMDANANCSGRDEGGGQHILAEIGGHSMNDNEAVSSGGVGLSGPRGKAARGLRRKGAGPLNIHLLGSTPTDIDEGGWHRPVNFHNTVANASSIRMSAYRVSSNPRAATKPEAVQEPRGVDGPTPPYTIIPSLGNSDNDVTPGLEREQLVATAPSTFVSIPVPAMNTATGVTSSIATSSSVNRTLPPWRRANIHRRKRPGGTTGREGMPPPNNRQLLQQRLQKYKLSAKFDVDRAGPQHAQQWRGTFRIGSYQVGQSSWYSSKDAAKEDAASRALVWMNRYGYP
ncbi:hypothetical protein CPB86DRAFT_810220 [Serendipita vermifera]|nr:hypothetical protein CPB86DRAFT_810220 [Serendipita vermifera]